MRRLPITGYTELIGLIATPIRHSMSPTMYNIAFDKLGMDYVYLTFEVGRDGLEATVNGLRAMGVRGFNVSMPNKTAILPYLDHLMPVARLSGAVNTVINDQGHLIGTNTDGIGWVRSVQALGAELGRSRMTLLGAGGAATAVLTQAALSGIPEIAVFTRQDEFWERAVERTALIRQETGSRITLQHLEDQDALRRSIADSNLLTNATNVGMKPLDQECLVPEDMLHRELIVTECGYNPRTTILLRRAERAGCTLNEGINMMLYQGAENFRLWFGRELPMEEVRAGLGLA